jgi:Cu(I)/Ag(I) efflux system membrane fusion protein
MTLISRMKERGRHLPRYLVIAVIGFAAGAWIFAKTGQDKVAAAQGGAGEGDGPAEAEEKSEEVYSCSMCPQIRQPEPGLCPICGMDLILISADDAPADLPAEHVMLSEEAKTLARIRTALVRRQDEPGVDMHLLGRIETKESNFRSVTAWTGGRIDRLHVNVTGQNIRKGQVIATLYSPEIFAAHQDLLVAKRQLGRMAEGTPAARAAADSALSSIRERLKLLGVPDEDIARMEKAKAPWNQIPIRSQFGGTVLERVATEGAYVKTGAPLYRVANLGSVWVQLDAYESDLPSLSLRQPVQIRVEGLADELYEGRISFIDPTLNPMRRTARVRVEVRNRGGKLRPGMFVQATVRGSDDPKEQARPMLIPASAPLFTGKRSVVYVEVPDMEKPTYEARVVRLGPLSGDSYPVIAGLRSGERVVIHGAFVLDADLQIRGGASMMMAPDDREGGSWDQVVKLGNKQRSALKPLVETYLSIQKALADDALDLAKKAAKRLGLLSKRIELAVPGNARAAFQPIAHILRQQSIQLMQAESIEIARADFEMLSGQIEQLLRVFGNPLSEPVRQAYCSMAFNNRGASWIQKPEEIANSYFGDAMLRCGEIRATIDPGGYLAGAKAPEPQAVAPAPGGHQH